MKRYFINFLLIILPSCESFLTSGCSRLDKKEDDWKYDSSTYSRADNNEKMKKARAEDRQRRSQDDELENSLFAVGVVGVAAVAVGTYAVVTAPFHSAKEKKAKKEERKRWDQNRDARMALIREGAKNYRKGNPANYDEWLEYAGQTFDLEAEPESRREIVEAVAAIEGQRADSILIRAMFDPSPAVRKTACVQWGQRENPWTGAAPVRRLLEKETDPEVRCAAAETLKKY